MAGEHAKIANSFGKISPPRSNTSGARVQNDFDKSKEEAISIRNCNETRQMQLDRTVDNQPLLVMDARCSNAVHSSKHFKKELIVKHAHDNHQEIVCDVKSAEIANGSRCASKSQSRSRTRSHNFASKSDGKYNFPSS